MLDFFTSVTESQSYNNFSMKEKTPVAKINLRGSYNIAGIVNKTGKILGMMPHPERASDKELGNVDGKMIFDSMMKTLILLFVSLYYKIFES